MIDATPGLRIALLNEHASIPESATEGAAGMDLRCASKAPIKLPAGDRALIPTGLAVAIPYGYEGQVRPRSGLAAKQGITVLNSPGTIDSDYRGELMVLLHNTRGVQALIKPGDRIAQLVIAPVTRLEIEQVTELDTDETERGSGGFGSTGTN